MKKRGILLALLACVALCAAGCGGEAEDKDAAWLPGAPEDTVTIPLENGGWLEFEQVRDRTAQDMSQWTSYAVITCYAADDTVSWTLQTEPVYGWEKAIYDTESEEVGPYLPDGAAGGKFFFVNLCPELSFDADIPRDGTHTITAVDVVTGKILWEAEFPHVYLMPTSLKMDLSGSLLINRFGHFYSIDSDGMVLEDAVLNHGYEGTLDVITDTYFENGRQYVELYSPEYGTYRIRPSVEPLDWDEWSEQGGRWFNITSYLEKNDILSWQQNYIEYIQKLNEDPMGSVVTYHLAYLDEDEIPELLIHDTVTQYTYRYTYRENEKGEYTFISGTINYRSSSLRYIEHENNWCSGYKTASGAVEFSWNENTKTKAKKTPNGDGTFSYTIAGREEAVTEEEFYAYLTEQFDPAQATVLDLRDGLKAEEVIAQISKL